MLSGEDLQATPGSRGRSLRWKPGATPVCSSCSQGHFWAIPSLPQACREVNRQMERLAGGGVTSFLCPQLGTLEVTFCPTHSLRVPEPGLLVDSWAWVFLLSGVRGGLRCLGQRKGLTCLPRPVWSECHRDSPAP